MFDHPLTDAEYDPTVGRSWPLTGLQFDAEQYEAEVRRLAADTSWETPRRRTARLVEEHLDEQHILLAAPELDLQWVAPDWDSDGVVLSFFRRSPDAAGVEDMTLQLTSNADDPDEASAEIAHRLATVDPRDWSRSFGYRT